MSSNILYFLADCAVANFYGTVPFYRNPPAYGFDFKMDTFRYMVNCSFARIMYLKKINIELKDIELEDVADIAHCGWKLSYDNWRNKMPESHRAFMDTRDIQYCKLPQQTKQFYEIIAQTMINYVYNENFL